MILAAFTGCAPKIGASGKAPVATPAESVKPFRQDAVRKGKQLAATNCIACHRFYFPKEYSPKQWDVILERKRDRLSLTQGQLESLAAYFKRRVQ